MSSVAPETSGPLVVLQLIDRVKSRLAVEAEQKAKESLNPQMQYDIHSGPPGRRDNCECS
jgi:hypothetical protein